MPNPTELTVHQKSRLLDIAFDDGAAFSLPIELMRVYSPSAEVKGHGPGQEVLQLGKREVGISAVEPVDWHHIEEHRFAQKVAAAMEHLVRARRAPALVVVAPPRTLADLRGAFHPDVQVRIIAEINKDLTKHPIGEIERHLTGSV